MGNAALKLMPAALGSGSLEGGATKGAPTIGMGIPSSDSDDLEQALQENLKLRRQLGQKITKARDRNAKDRVGWALYWVLLALAGTWMLVWLGMLHGGRGAERAIEVFMQNPFEHLALMGIPALLLYSLGRVIRYALSGE